MAGHPGTTFPGGRPDLLATAFAAHGRVGDLPANRRRWLTKLPDADRLPPGKAADLLRVPEGTAGKLLQGVVRFVVDVPAGTNLTVVWQAGADELAVDAGSIGLECSRGLVTVSVLVGCDQLAEPVRVFVPLAVGTLQSPRGLLMSAFTRVEAPALVAEGWSDAITAFCWEALLELARRISAETGRDDEGQPLIPGLVAAERRLLLIGPMARHDLRGLAR
ncbi:MAG: hypothetical protein AVDCRST_MAG61-1224 [uncultured Friedmanniella sp.]|uniref:Uncharacterized protein n=1 Tax=uncultured Friedmanniella sp. TaxID=335381 RepID=A0A6J4KE07_9ACTN|nr:hypothetical protein [uncultured Friedmanniella sp.]CAA9303361.1 MAG: hypothetical protein AVDCRST_MAG61-1224 [uncultured Friedmanniella sp.]